MYFLCTFQCSIFNSFSLSWILIDNSMALHFQCFVNIVTVIYYLDSNSHMQCFFALFKYFQSSCFIIIVQYLEIYAYLSEYYSTLGLRVMLPMYTFIDLILTFLFYFLGCLYNLC